MGNPEHEKIWVPEIRFVHTFQRIKIVEFSGGVCFQIRLKLAETSPENSVQTLANGHYRQKPALLLVQISCSRSASGVLATDLTRGLFLGYSRLTDVLCQTPLTLSRPPNFYSFRRL